jgi:spore coat protein U-like protein
MNWNGESSVNRALAAAIALLCACTARADITCQIVSSSGIAFGVYDTLSAVPTDTLTNIRVFCERNGGPQIVVMTMRLGPGANGTSASDRRMRQLGGGTDYLAYGLYRDVSRSAVWGSNESVDTVSQTVTIAVPNKGTQTATFTIYGRIPALQDVSAGSYADSVQITLTP